ncbi:MAG: aminomethyl-transferring glycine dehydrogenase subunit GcvPA [Candidatus Bipolaricaulota bacterium]
MGEYIPHTPDDISRMLETIGVDDVEELFTDIPRQLRHEGPTTGLPPRDEAWVRGYIQELAGRSTGTSLIPFLGGGLYDHHIPSVVGHVLSRGELFTAYTPYQAEVSQGTLTWMFEFQTMVCELTAMEVANASMYDGATALAEAVLCAHRARGGETVLVTHALSPWARSVLDTYCWGAGLSLQEIPYGADGKLRVGEIPKDTCALVAAQPNYFGCVEDLTGLKERLGKAMLIVSANPTALAVLEPPGAFGADFVVGEGQPLGIPFGFGGPLLGLFAARSEHLRRMPGRVSGRTVDADGNDGYVMALQTREQHIRREKATSNICTNSALCALAATVYLAALGPEGLRNVALTCLEQAHELAKRLAELPGYELAFDGPFFHEFALRCPDAEDAARRLEQAGIAVLPPSALQPAGLSGAIGVAVTERRTEEELDRFVAALEGGK